MGEEHLDFAPLDKRGHLGVGLADFADNIARGFMYRTHHASAGWSSMRLPSDLIRIFWTYSPENRAFLDGKYTPAFYHHSNL